MHPTLIDTLSEINYPVTILTNYPQSGSSRGEEELMKLVELVEQAKYPNLVSVHIDRTNAEPWEDKILETIPEVNGLLILNIQLVECSWHFTIAIKYSPEEVSKLRTTRNIGSQLHAYCHMANDLTQPLLLCESNDSTLADTGSLAIDSSTLEEIAFLDREHCLFSSENIAVYMFKGKEAPAVLRLIGIGRAITFAAIGAGSGQEIDLAPEDKYYDHIMLWDKNFQCLIGAYRVGFTEEIINEHGTNGLYLDHVFNFKREYYELLGNAMELSRSFILPSYQKNPQMLDALWKGLAMAAVGKNCYTMYGSVTISDSFTPLSQAILVDTLDRYHSETQELRASVSSKHPYLPSTINHHLVTDAWAPFSINKLNSVIEYIEQDQRSIPPLIRYYIALGAKFLAFQVEESFSNAIYCLLKVDLKALPKRYKRRFLGAIDKT